jgi:hypothetical protein
MLHRDLEWPEYDFQEQVHLKEAKMAEEQFECAACGAEYDREMAVQECRMCHRRFCDQCLNSEGICVPCEDQEKQQAK